MAKPSHQSVLIGVCGGRGSAADVDLGEDVAEVSSHRFLAEEQDRRDSSVGVPLRHQHKHLTLTRSERVPRACAFDRSQRRKIRLCAQLLEDRTSGVELHPGRVVVTDRSTCRADQDPGTRSLVRRVDLLPERPRLPEQRQGSLRITLCKLNLTAGMS